MATDLLHATEKHDLATFQGRLEDMDPGPLESQTVDDWLSHALATDGARAAMLMVIRTTTYTNHSDRLSAGAALRQLKLARAGVLYLDEGWGAMVGRLAERTVEAGVRLESSRPVRCVEEQEDRAVVRFGDGSIADAAAVVIATRPREALELLGDNVPAALSRSIAAAESANVACLDVGLRQLPKPNCQFALGFDQPLYLSVHSSVARLAPEGGALIHTAKYLGPEPSDPAMDRRELEALLDVVQPGWRGLVEAEQFLPSITVTDAVPLAGNGGLPGRLGPEVPGYKRVLFAGDWVGPQGLLADASLASANQAAALATEVSRTWAVDVLRG
jgi:phytoene dehydrogenase-like protein